MITTIGWIGSICFAISAIPQAYKSYCEGHSDGISWGLLILSFVGEVLSLIYGSYHRLLPLICNYTLNLIFLGIIIYYKRKAKDV